MIKKLSCVLTVSVCMAGMLTQALSAQSSPPNPAATAGKSTRTPQAIMAELMPLNQKIGEALGHPNSLFDADHRAKIAPVVVPLLKKSSVLMDEIASVQPAAATAITQAKRQIVMYCAILNDTQALADLKTAAASKNADDAAYGKSTLLAVRWIQSQNSVEQQKVLTDLDALAKEYPASNDLLAAIAFVRGSPSAKSPEVKQRLLAIIRQLKSPMAAQMREILEQNVKLATMENKPLAFTGKTLDGKNFDSATLKGKVVLVDFWATWCGPCIAEMPDVIETYKKYRAQGFEIVGVSNDTDIADLKEYLKQNPDVSWVQLFEPGLTSFHPLAVQYGIVGIPTMFLIDRKGVLRTVEARENMDEMIPKLLAEK